MVTMKSAGSPVRALLAALATSSLFLAGCSSSMAPLESVGGGAGHASAQISGKIHGGNQPVAGATVTLYRASQVSFASGAIAVAHTTSAADGFGSFAFQSSPSSTNSNADNTYNCDQPANTTLSSPFLFLVARGGTTVNTPGALPNPDSVFIAPLGRCNAVNASTFVNMSEVVTVATMAALHQFMTPPASGQGIENSVGADGIFASDLALGNALYSVSNMVSLTDGTANAPFVKQAAGVNLTVTPELAKINQLANALSACINYSGSGNPNCATLYNSAPPPSDTASTSVGGTMNAAQDPLTALYYIFANPTNSVTLGGDGTTNRTALFNLSTGTGAPYQPTMAAVPTDWSIGLSFKSTSTCSDIPSSTAGFLSNPSNISIDLYGNVFFSNLQPGSASLGSLDGTGTPTGCTTLAATGGQTAGGSMATTVDSNGVVYAGVLGTTDGYTFTPSPTAPTSAHFTAPAPILGLAADGSSNGSSNIFISTADGRLFKTVPGSFASTQISAALDNGGGATSLIVDPLGRIWASGSAAGTANKGTVTYPDGNSSTGYTTVAVNSLFPGAMTALTVGRDSGTRTTLYGTNGTNVLYAAYGDAAGAPLIQSAFYFAGRGIAAAKALAVDGAENLWVANATGSIVGLNRNGTPFAPNGFVKDPSYFGNETAISIDTAGNIWVAAGPNTITEVVGAAVPVMKSYASALSTGRFQRIP